MKRILELEHVHYAYHTPEGETPALTDLTESIKSP